MQETKKLTRKIEGWLGEGEGSLLYSLAKNCKGHGVIVEIGSWKGKSTVWLSRGSKAGKKAKVYAVDTHKGSAEHGKVRTFDDFRKNIKKAGVSDIVVPIVKTSKQAAKNFNKPVELIFFDGSHDFKSVSEDFDNWFPKIIEGGYVAFHDSVGGWPGPMKLVEEKVFRSNNFKDVGFIEATVYAQKVETNSLYDRLRSFYILLLKKLYEGGARIYYHWYLPDFAVSLGKKLLKFQ